MKPGTETGVYGIPDFLEHPSEDAMERFLLHQSGDEETEAIETHFLACEACVSRLEDLEQYMAAMKSALQELHVEAAEKAAQRQTRQSWFSLRSLSLAGAVAALALVFTVVPKLTSHRPVATVDLSAYRGMEQTVVPKGWPLRVRINATDLAEGPVTVQVVNRQGSELWRGTAIIRHESAELSVPEIREAGPYFVRLYRAVDRNPEGDLLREFAVQVH